MSSTYTEIRGQAMGIEPLNSAPTEPVPVAGRMYEDNSTGKFYVYNGSVWRWAVGGTTTSTSTTSSSTSSTSSSSSSTSSTSTSSTSSSTSSTSSSTSTTLL